MFQLRLLSLTAATAGLVGTGAGVSAQTVLKYNNWLPPQHTQVTQAMRPWAAEVEKATNGRVKVEFTPASLGAPPRQYDLAVDGVADIVVGVHGYTPGRFKLPSIAELPAIGGSAEARSVAYWRVYEKHLAKAGEHKGVVTLAVFTHGPGTIMLSGEPITRIEGFKGKKMRVAGGLSDVINPALGGVNVPAPVTETRELLSRGVIDGVYLPSEAYKNFKLEGVVKSQTNLPGGFFSLSFFVVMNKAAFDKLPDEAKKALMSISGEHLARFHARAFDAADKEGLAEMEKAGVRRITADLTLVKEIADRTAFVEKEWLKAAATARIDGPAALKMFKDEVKSNASN